MNYYNEFEPKAVAALKQLIVDGLIPKGDVDERSITEVTPSDLAGYTQCHFFAGIGGWPLALRLAMWPDDRPVWTGSCPCQPFSTAGKGKGGADHRDLWPVWDKLIAECRPPRVYGEQVASAVPHGWLDRVYFDMEGKDYACGASVLPACSVDAPHKRDRLWFVADVGGRRCGEQGEGKIQLPGGAKIIGANNTCDMADSELRGRHQGIAGNKRTEESPRSQHGAEPNRCCDVGNPEYHGLHGCQITGCDEEAVFRGARGQISTRESSGADTPGTLPGVIMADPCGQQWNGGGTSGEGWRFEDSNRRFWSDFVWIICGDGKARRIPTIESGIRILAHGIPERVGLLRAGGNAIVPEVAARFITGTEQAISGIW